MYHLNPNFEAQIISDIKFKKIEELLGVPSLHGL